MRPDVTICIPTYNQNPAYLAAAVNSALAQTLPVDIVIIDDGSDVPIPIAGPGNVRVIRHASNQGIAAALNTGIEATRTHWWCWLSSDDLIDPMKVEVQIQATVGADAMASFHPYRVIKPSGEFMGMSVVPNPWPTLKEQMTRLGNNCWINGSTTMVRTRMFAEVGMFDCSIVHSQDWEMWCRIGQRYLWKLIPETLGTRREGENNTERIRNDRQLQVEQHIEDSAIRAKYSWHE